MKKTRKFMAFLLVCAIQVLSLSGYSAYKAEDGTSSAEDAAEATAAPIESIEDGVEVPLESLSELSAPDNSKAERFIVKYKRNRAVGSEEMLNAALSEKYRIQSVKEVAFTASHGIGLFSAESTEEIQVIELDEAVDIEEFSADMKSEYSIDYVQPDYKVDLSAEEDSPYASETEPAEEAEPEISEYETKKEIIEETAKEEPEEEPEYSDFVEDSKQDIIVALIDTGIDIENECLRDRIYRNDADKGNDEDGNGYTGDISGWDFYNDSPEVYNADLGLDQAHGTHIAGIIAESAPDAKILPLKVFENGIAYTSELIEAIQYADTMGADIVNCSWGCTEENRALKEAMESSEMIFVCAAGNNRMDLNETPIYPACYDLNNVISVTSVNGDGGLSYFSNYGKADIAALGRDVEGIFPNGETGTLTGTSISAGFVSGALASVYTDPEETVKRLYRTSDKLSNLQGYVTDGRRLNMDALLSDTENNEVIDVDPAEDFNAEGYSRTPEQSWALFSSLDNISAKAGKEFLAVLKADGSVWTWGRNNYGQLGNGTYTNSTIPQQVPSLSNIAQIDAGSLHMLALSKEGVVYAWGHNENGTLGNGTTSNSNVPVTMLNAVDVKSICAGEKVSFVINNAGKLYICGLNYSGEQGDATQQDKPLLHPVAINEAVRSASGEYGSCMAVTESGKVYTWGSNYYNKLGNGKEENNHQPQLIIDSGIMDVSMGYFSAMAMTNSGEVYFWGYSGSKTPSKLSDIAEVSKINACKQEEFVLCGNTIKSRGTNASGSLGVGDTNWHSTWTEVIGEFSVFFIIDYMGIAIGKNGCIYTWGIIDIDTGEYVTAPEKISGKINDFGGDSFDQAATVEEGLTHGNLIDKSDVDYYKFTPSQTGKYSFYSISTIDLVCKIYTKSSDGSYTLKFSNDDSSMMSSNNRDFYLMAPLTAQTDYYIYVYPYSKNYEGEYELHIGLESSEQEYAFYADANKTSDVYINVNNVSSFANRTIKVIYDPSQLTLADGCIFTKAAEKEPGAIQGTNITIVSATAGELVFTVSRSIPTGQKLSGTVNIIRFTSPVSGNKKVKYEIKDATT